MAKVIDFQVPRCLDEYLTIDDLETGKAAQIKDWQRRYPKDIQQEAMCALDLREPFESPSLYRRVMNWLNRKEIGF